MQNLLSEILSLIYSIPIVLISLTVHEVAHGYMAYKLGDPTARNFGRLSLNPLKHLDPLGALCMLLFRFGWAKPVPVNSRYFKKPKRDGVLVALAGPLSNILLSFLMLLLYAVFDLIFSNVKASSELAVSIMSLTLGYLTSFSVINISFAIFNLIPCPPLDGSKIFLVWLPMKIYYSVLKYERYFPLALMGVIMLERMLGFGILTTLLGGAAVWIIRFFCFIINLVPFFSI